MSDTTIDPETGLSPHLARLDQTAGLRMLADFLDAHPDVPIPTVHIAAQYVKDPQRVAAGFVDGASDEDTTITPSTYDASTTSVRRRFAGLTVLATFKAEDLGQPVESVVTQFTPYTLAEVQALTTEGVPA